MSFILDALKKSETERAEQGQAEFSSVPTGSPEQAPMPWLWMIGGLLAVNLAILLGLLLRPGGSEDDAPAAPPPVTTERAAAAADAGVATQQPADTQSDFSEQVAVAIAQQERQEQVQQQPAQTTGEEATQTSAALAPPSRSSRGIPTIDQLRLDGTLTLEPLHLDIHVYSEHPADRFVFINMVKHREQSMLAEGPRVHEITADGVILEHRGSLFLLPRE